MSKKLQIDPNFWEITNLSLKKISKNINWPLKFNPNFNFQIYKSCPKIMIMKFVITSSKQEYLKMKTI